MLQQLAQCLVQQSLAGYCMQSPSVTWLLFAGASLASSPCFSPRVCVPLCFHKHAALTRDRHVHGAQADCPTFSPGQSRTSVLQAAAMAAKWWEPPRDALDTMVLGAADLGALSGLRHADFAPFDPVLKARAGV